MPPRKSNVSQASANGDESAVIKEPKEKHDGTNIEDLSLPRTMVQRLAKGVLPPNTQIQKDAITAMSKGATVFVSHIANAANEITLQTSRKTIAPQHVLDALAACEYGDFLPRVEAELKKFNEIATGKRNEYRRKVKEKESGAGGKGADEGGDDSAGVGTKDQSGVGEVEEEYEEGERAAKRPRREDRDSGAITSTAAAVTAQHGTESKAGAVDEDADRGDQTDDDVDQDAMDEGQNENEQEEIEEDEDEDEEQDEEEEEGSESGASDGDGGGSAPEMEERLRAVQGGFGSGAEDESDESD
ncbi:MAG: hypothetical protein Q9167_000691 [Letrouitia subvulpina]